MAEREWNEERTYLRVRTSYQEIYFYMGKELLAGPVDGRLLSKEIAGGFTGTVLGLYASSNGRDTDSYADFDWFEYQGLRE